MIRLEVESVFQLVIFRKLQHLLFHQPILSFDPVIRKSWGKSLAGQMDQGNISLCLYSETCIKRPLPWETTCLEGPHITVRSSFISVQYWNLSPKTTFLKRPNFFLDNWAVFQELYCILCICIYPADLWLPFQRGRDYASRIQAEGKVRMW